jgi:hypothetical protein
VTDYPKASGTRSVNKRTRRPPGKICNPIEELYYATADSNPGRKVHKVPKIVIRKSVHWYTYECIECGARYHEEVFLQRHRKKCCMSLGSHIATVRRLTWRLDMIPISPNPSESSPEVSDQELAMDEEPEASPRTGSPWEKSTSVFIKSVDSLKSGRKLDEIECKCSSPCQTIMLRPNCRTVVSQYIYSRSYYLV